MVTDVALALREHGYIRGENWTAAVFGTSSYPSTVAGNPYWAHVKYLDDGQTSIGFDTQEKAIEWAVNTLMEYLR